MTGLQGTGKRTKSKHTSSHFDTVN